MSKLNDPSLVRAPSQSFKGAPDLQGNQRQEQRHQADVEGLKQNLERLEIDPRDRQIILQKADRDPYPGTEKDAAFQLKLAVSQSTLAKIPSELQRQYLHGIALQAEEPGVEAAQNLSALNSLLNNRNVSPEIKNLVVQSSGFLSREILQQLTYLQGDKGVEALFNKIPNIARYVTAAGGNAQIVRQISMLGSETASALLELLSEQSFINQLGSNSKEKVVTFFKSVATVASSISPDKNQIDAFDEALATFDPNRDVKLTSLSPESRLQTLEQIKEKLKNDKKNPLLFRSAAVERVVDFVKSSEFDGEQKVVLSTSTRNKEVPIAEDGYGTIYGFIVNPQSGKAESCFRYKSPEDVALLKADKVVDGEEADRLFRQQLRGIREALK